MTTDLYKVLGIHRDTDLKGIQNAYRQQARKHHPDRNPGDPKAEEKFRRVKLAYEVLSDPARRGHYDRTGEFEDRAPDNTHSPLMATLSAVFCQALGEIIGIGQDPLARDLVTDMKLILRNRRKSHAKHLKDYDAVKRALEKFPARLTERDKPLLSAVAKAQLSQLEVNKKALEAQDAGDKAALEFLETCTFRPLGPWSEEGTEKTNAERLLEMLNAMNGRK